MLPTRWSLLTILVLVTAAVGQVPYMIGDLDTRTRGTVGSSPRDFVLIGNMLFFSAHPASAAPGTLLVHDLSTNRTDVLGAGTLTEPRQLIEWNSKLYFLADSGAETFLCTSDGTAPGTKTVYKADSALGLVTAAGRLFWSSVDPQLGRELHCFDGTSVQVLDIRPGLAGANPVSLAGTSQCLFFSADDGKIGYELWRSDGTPSGTTLVADILRGSVGSNPQEIHARWIPTAKSHRLVFAANSPTDGTELWTSDGTATGTRLVKDIRSGNQGSWPRRFAYLPVRDRYLFQADTDLGFELWTTDLSAAGTTLVKDINPGVGGSLPRVHGVHNGLAFLTASDGAGQSLWLSDGTGAGTRQIQDTSFLIPSSLVFVQGSTPRVWFFRLGKGLWLVEGTGAGASLVSGICPGGSAIGQLIPALNGAIVFQGTDWVHGAEPWVSDGTETGTRMLVDVNTDPEPAITHGSSPHAGVSLINRVWFAASNEPNRERIWRSTGEGGAILEVPTSVPMTGIEELTRLEDGKVVWTALDQNGQRRLATASGFLAAATEVAELTVVGGRLFFSAFDPQNGTELWTSLGTASTTHLVTNIRSGTGSSKPTNLVPFRGEVFFIAANDLWRSDGTKAGTVKILSVCRGPMVAAGGFLYFSCLDNQYGIGQELWKTDGTPAGTALVKDINPGAASSTPYPLAALGDIVLVEAMEPQSGRKLWRTDGTAAGTVLVKDLFPTGASAQIRNVAAAGDKVFFAAVDARGQEPWVSDGTAAGTFRLADIHAGYMPSRPGPFLVTGSDQVWFAAESAEHGRELWRSDGTVAGTVLAADLVPGPWSSDPELLGVAEADKPRLLFAATDWFAGREPYALDLSTSTRVIGQGCAENAPPPSLRVDAAMSPLFAIADFGGRDARPNSSVFVMVGPKPQGPLPFLGCTFYVGFPYVLAGPFQPNNGVWNSSVFVQASQAKGVQAVWQAVVWPAPGPRGFDLTNGVITAFGQ